MQTSLPKKITPDYIKDALVQIRFIPKVHSDAVFGIVFQSIDDSYIVNESTIRPTNNPDFTLKVDTAPEFFTDLIRIQILPYSFVFNIKQGTSYIGWEKYFNEIKRFLNQINASSIFAKIDFVGLRYISEYKNTDLKELVDFNFGFGLPEITSTTYSFKSEFEVDKRRVILNLHNKLPVNKVANILGSESTFLTHIDIDVNSRFNYSGDQIENVLQEIFNIHETEKKVFWSLIKSSYKKEIEVQY